METKWWQVTEGRATSVRPRHSRVKPGDGSCPRTQQSRAKPAMYYKDGGDPQEKTKDPEVSRVNTNIKLWGGDK